MKTRQRQPQIAQIPQIKTGGRMLPVEAKDPQTYEVIGAAMEVHRTLGRGFLEYVYQQALAVELGLRGVPFKREVELCIHYKGHVLDCRYKADFVCFDDLILETKSLKQLTNIDRAQTLNELRATNYTRALLINFGASSLEYERIVHHFS